MIRRYSLFIRLLDLNVRSKSIYEGAVRCLRAEKFVCPRCLSKGALKYHGSYERNLVEFIHGRVIDNDKVKVLRYKCEQCKSTHALLPDVLIPYGSYSIIFILKVIAAYYVRYDTIE